MGSREATVPLLLEPFAGGGTVSLTAVMEGFAERALMVELDADVAAFWQAALEHGPELIARVQSFEPTRERVHELQCREPADTLERGISHARPQPRASRRNSRAGSGAQPRRRERAKDCARAGIRTRSRDG